MQHGFVLECFSSCSYKAVFTVLPFWTMFVPASKLNGFGEQIGIYVQEDTSKYQLFVVI
jgi:hypothetical protein